MATFKKYDIGEASPVVLDLANHLSSDHLCKQIEQVVSDLDASCIEEQYSGLGQHALHPKLLLSIIFYGYTTGIRSGRKLSIACRENLPFIYLSKGYFPGKSVINDFRKDNHQHFSDLFKQILVKCMELGLGDPKISISDGSKISAHSSKRRTKDLAGFKKWRQTLAEDIASLEEVGLNKKEVNSSKKNLRLKSDLKPK